jgi:hypothetical protein
LTISEDIEIIGHGPDLLTVDANGGSRVFNVNAGVAATIRGLTITGGNAYDGAGIYNAGDITLEQVTIADNVAGGSGAGIYNAGELTVDQVVVTGNVADMSGGGLYSTTGYLLVGNSTFELNEAAWGGGIWATSTNAAGITIVNSTINNNEAVKRYTAGPTWVAGSGSVGGVHVGSSSSSVPISVVNTTISGNTAEHETAGLGVDFGMAATVDIRNSTIAYNHADSAGGGIGRYGGVILMHNSILAKNTAGTSTITTSDLHYGNVHTNSSYNIISGSWWGSAPSGAGNQIADPLLAPLGDYGGATRTHALLLSSPALDKGLNSLAGSTDQRSAPRPFDLPGVTNGGAGIYADIGAFEAGESTVLTVRENTDRNTISPFLPDDLSLREALALAAALAGTETTIAFAPSVDDIILGSQLTVGSDVTIVGPGADLLTIDANGGSRVFNVNSGVEATIRGLTITGGNVTGDGGGIYNAGDLTLDQVRVMGNTASSTGGGLRSTGGSLVIINSTFELNEAAWGGGLWATSTDAAGIVIANSTINNNEALKRYTAGPTWVAGSGSVGGVHVGSTSSSVPIRVVNTTISTNTAEHETGGLGVDFGMAATVEIVNSTIAYNHADSAGGGIGRYGGVVLLHNSIVAENTAGTSSVADSDIHYGSVHTNSSYNIIGAGWWGSAPSGAGNSTYTDPLLAPLGDYGGPTKTHALTSTSPAIDAGDDSFAATYDLAFDQRGRERIVDWDEDEAADNIDALELAIGDI